MNLFVNTYACERSEKKRRDEKKKKYKGGFECCNL